MVVKGKGLSVGKYEVGSTRTVVGETGGEIWAKKTETFKLNQLVKLMSVLVVIRVSESCMFSIKVCKKIDRYVGVVE